MSTEKIYNPFEEPTLTYNNNTLFYARNSTRHWRVCCFMTSVRYCERPEGK